MTVDIKNAVIADRKIREILSKLPNGESMVVLSQLLAELCFDMATKQGDKNNASLVVGKSLEMIFDKLNKLEG